MNQMERILILIRCGKWLRIIDKSRTRFIEIIEILN